MTGRQLDGHGPQRAAHAEHAQDRAVLVERRLHERGSGWAMRASAESTTDPGSVACRTTTERAIAATSSSTRVLAASRWRIADPGPPLRLPRSFASARSRYRSTEHRRSRPGLDPAVTAPDLDVPLSVLDLAPVGAGSTAGDALRDSLDLAVAPRRSATTATGWPSTTTCPGIASSAPAVLLAHLASVTSTIRLGSGGVMLPNHAPLVIAEQFGMLEALHPGRIDLGIGRAPGTDQLHRGGPAPLGRRPARPTTSPSRSASCSASSTAPSPTTIPTAASPPSPARGNQPAIWLLGSSDYSAQPGRPARACPFSFAHHFAAANTDAALAVYRDSFRPSDELDEPVRDAGRRGAVRRHRRAGPLAGRAGCAGRSCACGRVARAVTRRPRRPPRYNFTPVEKEIVRGWTAVPHRGRSRHRCAAGLAELVDRTGADELMITTMAHGHDDRLRSYELVAELAGLGPVPD